MKLKGNRIVIEATRTTAAQFLAERLVAHLPETSLAEFLRQVDLLVPVPPSGLLKPDSVWPALAVAEAMVTLGIGQHVERCLRRVSALPKSAYAEPGARPGLREHVASLEATLPLSAPSRILLVDDVVTKGTTFLAAAQVLAQRLQGVPITAFAVFRTLGLQPEIENLLEPRVGRIWLDDGIVRREP